MSDAQLKELAHLSVEELTEKVVVASMLMKSLVGDSDPRVPEACERLRVQQEQVNVLIAEKTADTKPPPVSVGMKEAAFAARTLTPAGKGATRGKDVE